MAEVLRADVAIVGGGPAGLAAALELRRRGVRDVIVLEREPEAGGAPRHCGHPPFGLREFGRVLTGPAYARRLVAAAEAAGVRILTGHSVVALGEAGQILLTAEAGPVEVAPRRALLATGARETPRAARLLSGDRPLGVVTTGTLQAMIYLHGQVPFRRPLVLGTELVALSALLTCRRAGIAPVAVVEAAARPTASRLLAQFPRLLGVPVQYGAELLEILGRGRVEAVRVRRADGAVLALACDGVLVTGQFVPEAALVRLGQLELDPGSGGPAIDQFGRCSDPAWFAAGNALRAVETAGWCFREGRRIGACIAADLAGALPDPRATVPVARGPGLKYALPQRLAVASGPEGLRHLQIRVERATAGELSLSAGGAPVWRKRLAALPERRILVPLPPAPRQGSCAAVEVGFGR